MTKSTGNNFDGSDIQRYHSGLMSTEERHALEKAALDDPFLADAIEGYTYTTTPAEDLVAIQSRLEQITDRRKVIPLFTRTWMKVAVIVFVVAGGVWLLLNTQNNSKNEMAVEQLNRKENPENKKKDNNASTLQSVATDSLTKVETLADGNITYKAPAGETGHKDKSEKIVAPQADYVIGQHEEDDKINNQNSKQSNSQLKNYNYSTQANKDVANGVTDNTRNSRSLNDKNRMMPEVNVQDRLANNQVSANRVRSWTESDSIPTNFIALQRSQSDTIRQMNVVMTPQPSAPLNEVVVSKAFGKKETDMKGRMAGIVIDTLEPAEGWTNFDDYIAGNLKVPDELKLKPINNGEVELAFEVNQKGEPVNITVVKSLCTKCDEEAVRLLKQGPRWKKKKTNKGKVTIRF